MEELQQSKSVSVIRVIDNLYASLWAGYVLDLETVAGDFQYVEQWDYKSFKEIAERRGILRIQRSTFSLYPHERCQSNTAIDKRSKGRFSDQLVTYKTLMQIIFNATKAMWIEKQVLGYSVDESSLVDLKRNVCGLYLLYYLWHNQMPDDPDKVFINFTQEDGQRKTEFFDRLEKLSQLIPESDVATNCCKYTFSSLEKRNAFYHCLVADEPKLSYHFWEYLNLKESVPRMIMTQIASRCCKPSLVQEISITVGKLLRLLQDVDVLAAEPLKRSVLIRKILPKEVLQQLLLYTADNLQPTALMLPIEYKNIAASISASVNKNLTALRSPFLSLDGLMKSLNASKKLTALGNFAAESTQRRTVTSKLYYRRRQDQYNELRQQNRLAKKNAVKSHTMNSPVWNFLRRDFDKVFTLEKNGEAPVPRPYDTVEINPRIYARNRQFQPEGQVVDTTTNCFDMEDALTRRKRHRNILEQPTSSSSLASLNVKRERTDISCETATSTRTAATVANFKRPALLPQGSTDQKEVSLVPAKLIPLNRVPVLTPIVPNKNLRNGKS